MRKGRDDSKKVELGTGFLYHPCNFERNPFCTPTVEGNVFSSLISTTWQLMESGNRQVKTIQTIHTL